MPDWEISVGGPDDIDALGPLWVAVHHRHVENMPELAPYVTDAETWRVRRALYERLLDEPDTLLLLASSGDTLVGYGLAYPMPVDDSWIADTWVTGPRVGEIESLSVLPAFRGSGLGSELLRRLEQHLEAVGAPDIVLGALARNDDALRLYQRRGYRPTWLYLSKFTGR
ncbi:MAG: GNAT family N-acetyltransferase [Mycolicibacterium rufum]|nr:GNAT family N-acetyltransferase [Mycolicibacterium rufum]